MSLSFVLTLLILFIQFVFLFITIFYFILAKPFEKRTEKGALEYEQWMAFKRFLEDLTLMKEKPPSAVILWNHYLVYAVSLGCADKVLEYIDKLHPILVSIETL